MNLKTVAAALFDALSALEWVSQPDGSIRVCPACGRSELQSHTAQCATNNALTSFAKMRGRAK